MAAYKPMHVAVASFLLIGYLVTAIFITGLAFGQSAKVDVEDTRKLTERSALHMIIQCIYEGKDYADASTLDKMNGMSLCDACWMCSMDNLAVRIIDSENRIWQIGDFEEPNTEEDVYTTYINIKKAGSMLAGKIIMRI
jgi:hypothetical protein